MAAVEGRRGKCRGYGGGHAEQSDFAVQEEPTGGEELEVLLLLPTRDILLV